jgi:hypothetical protein
MKCPFCARQNAANALVCLSCARAIAAPESLIAELDDLMRRRDAARERLSRAKHEFDTLKRAGKLRPV